MKSLFFLIIILSLFPLKVSAVAREVYINEILPDAEGSDSGKEWIEIYNSKDSSISLKDYYFINRSNSGSERKISISSEINIPAKSFFVISESALNVQSENIFPIGVGKINLYNDESELELYNSEGLLIDSVHYFKPTESRSFERKGPEAISDCEKLVSHASSNTILLENSVRDPVCFGEAPPIIPVQESCLNIEVLFNLQPGVSLCTKGAISVEPNILENNTFYIASGGLGFKVKLKTPLELNLGDEIKITGVIKTIKDGPYLLAENIEILKTGQVLYPTKLINLKDQKYALIEIESEIKKDFSKSFDLVFNNSTIRTSILASTNINFADREVGDKLSVKGILVEESGIFKILPRYNSDLNFINEQIVVNTKSGAQKEDSEEIKAYIKAVDLTILNSKPSLDLRVENKSLPRNQLIISNLLILLILLFAIVFILALLFRKRLAVKFHRYFQRYSQSRERTEVSKLDFTKDKYDLLFGNEIVNAN